MIWILFLKIKKKTKCLGRFCMCVGWMDYCLFLLFWFFLICPRPPSLTPPSPLSPVLCNVDWVSLQELEVGCPPPPPLLLSPPEVFSSCCWSLALFIGKEVLISNCSIKTCKTLPLPSPPIFFSDPGNSSVPMRHPATWRDRISKLFYSPPRPLYSLHPLFCSLYLIIIFY